MWESFPSPGENPAQFVLPANNNDFKIASAGQPIRSPYLLECLKPVYGKQQFWHLIILVPFYGEVTTISQVSQKPFFASQFQVVSFSWPILSLTVDWSQWTCQDPVNYCCNDSFTLAKADFTFHFICHQYLSLTSKCCCPGKCGIPPGNVGFILTVISVCYGKNEAF